MLSLRTRALPDIEACDLSIEHALLCASVTWPVDAASITRLAERVTDWSHVQQLCQRHRVNGLVSHALLLAAKPQLPVEMQAWCDTQITMAGLLEMTAGADAQAAIGQLAQAGIPARLLKGPAVSITAFGRFGLRTNRDVDILVDPSQRTEAATVIEAMGWQRIEPEPGLSTAAFHDWLRNHKDFVFARPDGRMLELHWRLFNNVALLPDLDQCAIHHVANGAFVLPTLPLTENLLFLCVHGAEHSWSRLKWLADTAALMRQLDETALDHLLSEGKRRHVYPAVAQAVLLSAEYLGLPLRSDLERELRRNLRARLLKRIAVHAMFEGGARELEERRWGSTLKNIGHYAMADGIKFWWEELRFDLTDLAAADLPDKFRRFGPFARGAALIVRARRHGKVSE